MKTIDTLLEALCDVPSTDGLHNLYKAEDDPFAALHLNNLKRYLLDMQAQQPKAMFVLEAPGHRGCARTGIPITSERVMLQSQTPFGLFSDGYQLHTEKPAGMAESSATIFWAALTEYASAAPLLWNTVPLHPHKPDKAASNRTPRVSEQRMGYLFLEAVIGQFKPVTILAVGRIAQKACAEIGVDCIGLRHPSQGGKAGFIDGLIAAQV